MTNTPPIKGDSGGPCVGANCVDKQVYGFWPDKSIVDASGGTQVVAVTAAGPQRRPEHRQLQGRLAR